MDELYAPHPKILFVQDDTPETQSFLEHFGGTTLVSLYNYFSYYQSNNNVQLSTKDPDVERMRKELMFDIIIHCENGITNYPNRTKWHDWGKVIDSGQLFTNKMEFAQYMGRYLSHPNTTFFIIYMRTNDRRLLGIEDTDDETEPNSHHRYSSRSLGGKSKEFYMNLSSNLNFWNMPSYVSLLAAKIAIMDKDDDKTLTEYKEILEGIERIIGYDNNIITLAQVAAYLVSGRKVAMNPFSGFKEGSIENKWLGKLMYGYLKAPVLKKRRLAFSEYCQEALAKLSVYFSEENKEGLKSVISRLSTNNTNWWKLIEDILSKN
jgi:hypothetical protein